MITSTIRVRTIAGIACAIVPCSVGCDTVCLGTQVPSLTMGAAYRPTNGGPPATSSSTLSGTPISTGGWDAAISDAATAPTFTGFVVFAWSSGERLTLALPFPMTKNSSIPVTADRALITANSFSVGPARADGGITHEFDCAADIDACRAARLQTGQGSIQVESTSPLRLRIDATVTYGDGSLRGPDTFQGPISFHLEHDTICLD